MRLEREASDTEAAIGHGEQDRALALSAAGRWPDALDEWDRVVAAGPADPAALVNRAVALGHVDRTEDAIADLEAAIGLAPGLAIAHFNLGNLLGGLGRIDGALAAYDAAHRLDPADVDILCNRGNLFSRLGRNGDALADYGRVLAIRPGHVPALLSAAFCRLRGGDFARGWSDYEWRLPRHVREDPRRWRGDRPVRGRTILLHAEQGFGDTIQFCRYAPLVAELEAEVVAVVPPALRTLAATLHPAVRVVSRGEPLPRFDLHSPLGSMPAAFGTRLETVPAVVPYLHVPAVRALVWRARLESRAPKVAGVPRAGIVWAGNPANPVDRHRSMPLAALLPLAAAGLRLVSLQKAVTPADAALLAQAGIPDLGSSLEDFLDTAAVLRELDLVISVETAVAHLAGALARPLWIPLAHVADWRWLEGRVDSPWYPTATLFRQPRHQDWAGAVARMCERVRDLRRRDLG